VLDDSPEWKVDMAELLLFSGRDEEAAALLESASVQLANLRATAARRALQGRIEMLRERVGTATPG
jgi:hypothetical protein